MFRRILRMHGIVPIILILAALAYWWLHPRAPKIVSVGYISDRNVALWNTLAQVRQPIEELHYGDRVEVLRQEGNTAQVRTPSGAIGWLVDTRQMMDLALWERSAALLARARTMPVQARGTTKAVSNVRIEPSRNGSRIFQLTRGTPVRVLGRAVADAPPLSAEAAADEKVTQGEDQKHRQEDWLFVLRADTPTVVGNEPPVQSDRATTTNPASGDPVSGGPRSGQMAPSAQPSETTPIAGWVLARFIEPDLPGPVRDYASSADLHVVAWFELNRVPNGSGGEAPQYLVAGSRGGEGQPCDFTMLRVYTWGSTRGRYETAYVESDLCGHLPIQVSQTAAGPQFHFAEAGEKSGEKTYAMRQTSVSLVRDSSRTSPRQR